MSQFYGYTVDLVFKDPAGKTVRGVIDKIGDKEVVLKNPVEIKSDGSYDKINKKKLSVKTPEIADLNVVELAHNDKKYIKKQMKMLKEGDSNEPVDLNSTSTNMNNGTSKEKSSRRERKSQRNNNSNDNSNFDSELNNGTSSASGSKAKNDIEVKYVDVYNDKPKPKENKKVNELEEFDFASNLQKFDKESVFKNISKHDKTGQSSRLVSFNKANSNNTDNIGHKDKYGIDEMVLKQKSENDWNDDDSYDYSNIVNSNSNTNNISNIDSNISDAGESVQNNSSNLQSRQTSTASFERKTSVSPAFAQFFSSAYDDSPIPTCSTLQLSDILNICKNKFDLTEQILLENAGRSISELIINNIIGSFRIGFKNHNESPIVLLLVGNNRSGSIALNTGRHLFNRGLKTITYLLYDKEQSEEELLPQVDVELKRFSNIGGKIVNSLVQLEKLLKTIDSPLEFIIDGLQGYDNDINDLLESEFSQVLQLIEWCNGTGLPMMSLDIPTGLNASSGTNENEDNMLLLKSKYVASIGLPLSSALNMYKFGYFEKGKMSHYLVDCGIPRRVFSSKASLRKFDRRWFAESGNIDMKVV